MNPCWPRTMLPVSGSRLIRCNRGCPGIAREDGVDCRDRRGAAAVIARADDPFRRARQLADIGEERARGAEHRCAVGIFERDQRAAPVLSETAAEDAARLIGCTVTAGGCAVLMRLTSNPVNFDLSLKLTTPATASEP